MNARTLLTTAIVLSALGATARGQDYTQYIWEFPQASEVKLPEARQWMLEDLRTEIDKVLKAGHLAPYYFNAADLTTEGYFLYQEPGRIITTLAWAYPHLTPEQQQAVKKYVAAELANPAYAPWAGPKLPPYEGHGREGYEKPRSFNFDRWWGMEGVNRPFLHTLYGLWLYGYRTGDWETLKPHWPSIRQFYAANAAKAEIYSEYSAHLAVARLAHQFQDAPTEKAAAELAARHFQAGKDYPAIQQLSVKYFNRLKETRGNFPGSTSFMMMNLSPEVGRYLKDNVKDPVLQKNTQLKRRWTHWWVIVPANGGTWAGNIGPDCEGIGAPRELFGMIYPVERWVAESDPETLAQAMISGPDGLGDSYWLEPLVWTIEAYGKTQWVDVRGAAK